MSNGIEQTQFKRLNTFIFSFWLLFTIIRAHTENFGGDLFMKFDSLCGEWIRYLRIWMSIVQIPAGPSKFELITNNLKYTENIEY